MVIIPVDTGIPAAQGVVDALKQTPADIAILVPSVVAELAQVCMVIKIAQASTVRMAYLRIWPCSTIVLPIYKPFSIFGATYHKRWKIVWQRRSTCVVSGVPARLRSFRSYCRQSCCPLSAQAETCGGIYGSHPGLAPHLTGRPGTHTSLCLDVTMFR